MLAVAIVLLPRPLLADSRPAQDSQGDDKLDHTIIVGVGAATELELGDRSLHPGANVMVEWDAIENWLEFEVGASVLTADGGVEVPKFDPQPTRS